MTNASSEIVSCFAQSSGDGGLWSIDSLDPDNIYYTAGKVGVGIASPESHFHVVKDTAFNEGTIHAESYSTLTEVISTAYGGGNNTGSFYSRAARGAKETPEELQFGDNIGGIGWRGYNGVGWTGSKAYLLGYTSENWSPTNNGTRLVFATTANGTTVATPRMSLEENGKIAVGDQTPSSHFHVIKNTAFNEGTIQAESESGFTEIMSTGYGGGNNTGSFYARAARGTKAAPAAIQVDDNIGGLGWRAFNGSSWTGSKAYILNFATQNWTTTANGNKMVFATTANGTTVATPRMSLEENGKIAVGDQTPSSHFHVIKNTAFNEGTIQAESESGFTEIMSTGYGGGNNTGSFYARAARGTKAAPAAIQVDDNIGGLGWRAFNGSSWTGSKAYILNFATQNWTTTANGNKMVFATTKNGATAATVKMEILDNGCITYTGGNLGPCPSDKRLKKDIQELSKVDNFEKLKPHSFVMKDDEDQKTQYGLIAQDVEQYAPELLGESDEQGFLSVNYEKFKWQHVLATQALIKENKVLKQQNKMILKVLCRKFPEEGICR